jgi:hypothetical protein
MRQCLVLAEVDSFFLPDTVATDYRQKHTKTTIAVQEIDLANRKLGYFHNGGYYELSGDDFTAVLRIKSTQDPNEMPFFAEFARLTHIKRRNIKDLAAISMTSLLSHLERSPQNNPFSSYRLNFNHDLDWIVEGGMPRFHAYAFANIRQFGSAFNLCEHYLRWLNPHVPGDLLPIAEDCGAIAQLAKTLLLKVARVAQLSRTSDFNPLLTECEERWQNVMTALTRIAGTWHSSAA